jgi:hypothetical protein
MLKDFLYPCQADDKLENAKIAVQVVKDMQALHGADGDVVKEQGLMEQNVGRRKAIINIEASHKFLQNKPAVRSLDTAFKWRLSKAHDDGKDMTHCVEL